MIDKPLSAISPVSENTVPPIPVALAKVGAQVTPQPASHTMKAMRNHRRGFSIVEMMTAVGILGIVSALVLNTYLQAVNIYSYDAGKIRVNRDIRAFTAEMTSNATYANYFLIYPNFDTRTKTVQVTDPDTGAVTNAVVDAAVNDGQSGDMLVLVFKDDEDDTRVSRLVGYYRAPSTAGDSTSEGPVRCFDVSFSPSTNAAVNTLIPAVSTRNTNPEVIELSRGLANGMLFYNLYDRSVMVKGQIIHRGSLTKRATNTYNFTVSPRG